MTARFTQYLALNRTRTGIKNGTNLESNWTTTGLQLDKTRTRTGLRVVKNCTRYGRKLDNKLTKALEN